jgi:hypothetical protein
MAAEISKSDQPDAMLLEKSGEWAKQIWICLSAKGSDKDW